MDIWENLSWQKKGLILTLTDYNKDCTGDVVVGDEISFTEAVFGGSFKKPKFLGERTIIAKVVNDSYGSKKQQHTFTLKIISSSGYKSLEPGDKALRKGRNVYKNGTKRKLWEDESLRELARDEKHSRGGEARAKRAERIYEF
jgi:hypothetical protein